MHTLYGTEYEPLYANIEMGYKGRLVGWINLPNGTKQLCFLDDETHRQDGENLEVMITGVAYALDRSRRPRRKINALRIRAITQDDILMGIEGFVQANDDYVATALGFESEGTTMTQSTAMRTLDLLSCRPLSMGGATKKTRVLTPGATGACFVRNGSNRFLEGSAQLAEPTNVWASRKEIASRGRKPVPIKGLTRIEDLAVYERLIAAADRRKAA